MTMEVEMDHLEGAAAELIDKDQIINFLTNNEAVCFKSQQINEKDLSKQEKVDIASEIYNKSKLDFLLRFGRYLQRGQLEFFHQFTQNCEECDEIGIVLKDFLEVVGKKRQINIKNRRYEALTQMIQEGSYFSEVEMMKRNPLLYDQLVGQYLTEEEREARDKINIDEGSTLVKLLMEGIERDNAQVKRKEQEEYEDEESTGTEKFSSLKPSSSQWGEFITEVNAHTAKKAKTIHITPQEQNILRKEFISSMYHDFLSGKDDDFDYDSVDNNDKYDNHGINEYDEEDKYFDSEEPETISATQEPEESEDELDIFMSSLNQNPVVTQLSKDLQKL